MRSSAVDVTYFILPAGADAPVLWKVCSNWYSARSELRVWVAALVLDAACLAPRTACQIDCQVLVAPRLIILPLIPIVRDFHNPPSLLTESRNGLGLAFLKYCALGSLVLWPSQLHTTVISGAGPLAMCCLESLESLKSAVAGNQAASSHLAKALSNTLQSNGTKMLYTA